MKIAMSRRQLLALTAAGAAVNLSTLPALAAATKNNGDAILRPIPSSGEKLPVIGLGTSRTLDIDVDPATLIKLRKLMTLFIDNGGSLLDSSPMYGAAETVLGQITKDLPGRDKLFSATKVWTNGRAEGIAQMEDSRRKMGVDRIDLMQIHNLVDWQTHLKTLRDWKEQGKIRYIGITTSHGRHHQALEQIMRTEPLDFVQFSYNIDNRDAEQRLLPLAAEHGIATLINRPYQRGSLFSRSKGKALPALATELGCSSWGQFYLKFILAHPAVTCLIPATNKLHHMQDNMGAGFGPVPDASQRQAMLDIYAGL